jgi:hypothetical protein
MTDSQKSAVAGVLATAGLSVKETIRETVKVPVPGSGGALPEATQAEIRKLLKLAPDAPISAERLAEVSAMLVDFTLRLEQWGCSYWRSIAPEARTQLFQVLERDLAKFLAGDEKTTRDVVGDSVHNVRSLVSLLMKSAGEAGKQFSRDHVSRFAVQEIEREASTQAGVFKSMPVVAWEIYKRMMADMSAESMDKRFAGLIAKDVDAALGGVVRKRRT